MSNAEELEAFTFQIAAKLRTQRLAGEEARRAAEAACRAEEANRPPPLPRPTGKPEEFREFSIILMGPWVPGPDMGPMLPPRLAMTLGPITVNPLIAFPFSAQRRFHWDVRYSYEDAKYVTPNREIPISLPNARLQPATAPKVPRLFIISESFTWDIMVNARQPSAGVTVHDVLHTVCRFLHTALIDQTMCDASQSHRTAVRNVNRIRLSQSIGPSGICIFDLLLGTTKFGGLIHKPDHVANNFLREDDAFFVLSFEN
ncbi:hypothetical protein BDZ89DRAFT_1066559 [Hymenopellis radicata]|nr:hypothetical protein BDZ89DRAFT_1066559 [Hymenopellis radicata]